MYKHILVAIDGSETSNLALQEAIKLAKDQQAALRLVHVVDETPAYMAVEAPYQIADYQKALREGGQRVLSTCSAAVREAGIVPDTKLKIIETLNQHIYDAIEQEARQWPADLIVIGTHGRRGFRHLLLGSVAEGVIRVTTKPVLLIRGA
jgi:nucleotide-binding universal stress UspA family protein